MTYEFGALEATLAAASGNNPLLYEELYQVLEDSLQRQVELLCRARCDGNWNMAILRLKGLGASFHIEPLISLAEEALVSAPGEPTIIRKFQLFVGEFSSRRG